MRSNIRDIMKATKCTEVQANTIEKRINADWLLDWSECSMRELNKVARETYNKLFKSKPFEYELTLYHKELAIQKDCIMTDSPEFPYSEAYKLMRESGFKNCDFTGVIKCADQNDSVTLYKKDMNQ